MALNVGDILFTSMLTDGDTGSTSLDNAFSFVATTDIAAGETISFHAPEIGGDIWITFTVGANGLSGFDRVTIQTGTIVGLAGDQPRIVTDPSGGTVSDYNQSGTLNSFNLGATDNLIASSDGAAIAGIVNNTSSNWDDNISETGLDRNAIDAVISSQTVPSPVFTGVTDSTSLDDNAMYVGGDIAGIGDPANWVSTGAAQNHAAPDIDGTTYATQDSSIFCFAEGTHILTNRGEVPVETLRISDIVCTAAGRNVAVKWVGVQTVMTRFGSVERLRPVRILAGALGGGLPHRDLVLTADHALLLDGLLVNAGALVNGSTIDWVPPRELGDRFTVYHVETEDHDVILAEGAAAETYIDYRDRQAFDNYRQYLDLYGEERIISEMPYPRVSAVHLLPKALQSRLAPPNRSQRSKSAA